MDFILLYMYMYVSYLCTPSIQSMTVRLCWISGGAEMVKIIDGMIYWLRTSSSACEDGVTVQAHP